MTNLMKFLKIVYFNVNSLLSKRDEIINFLVSNDIDIALFSETFCKSYHKFYLRGYHMIRCDDPDDRRGGGVAIAVRDGIVFKEIKVPECISIPSVCGIRMKLANGEDICILSVYISNSITNISHLDLQRLFHLSDNVLIAGDFNARHETWNCVNNNVRGKSLHEFLQKQNSSFIKLHFPERPTYFPRDASRQPSTIDLCLTKRIVLQGKPISIAATNSDHNPVMATISLNGLIEIENDRLDYENANWSHFQAVLENRTASLSLDNPSCDDVESAVAKLTEEIKFAERQSVPPMRPNKDFLPPEIKALIKTKNWLRRQSQSPNLFPFERTSLKLEMNLLRNVIDREIKLYRNMKFKNDIRQIRPHDNRLYLQVKRLTKDIKPIPPLIVGNEKIYHAEGKAEAIASHFHSVHHLNDEMGSNDFNVEVETVVRNFLCAPENQYFPDAPLPTIEEVANEFRKLKSKKAPGIDGISNYTLKNIGFVTIVLFTTFISFMFKTGYFPRLWKKAKVTPLLKPGKIATHVMSYRPISLLCELAKIIERLIVARLKKELSDKAIIPNEQFGFREKTSTAHAVSNILNDSKEALQNKETVSIAFLDTEKAFDTVWVNGLLYKLIKCGISSWLIRIISSYLESRQFVVDVSRHLSSPKFIAAGVPQGSILGPFLFQIYIADLPTTPNTKVTVFADDTTVRGVHKNPQLASSYVQTHLDTLATYYNKWKIRVNAAKSESMVITRRRVFKDDAPLPLTMNGSTIPQKKHVKYLGVDIQDNCKFNHHCQRVVSRGNVVLKQLWRLIGPNSCLSVTNKIKMYKVYLRPTVTYNIQMWGDEISKSTFKKLQTFQNKCLRVALNVRPHPVTFRQMRNATIHSISNVPTLQAFCEKLKLNFLLKASIHPNPLISQLSRF